ncbi:alpha/beta fold hydrolase [Rhodococcus sp. NPDC057529]|uniref:alpha/beta fold hydrolase n=1 Tax=Rhodococcus sp. NPDC057529 TaxID=3346158 RepID=UPI00366E1621
MIRLPSRGRDSYEYAPVAAGLAEQGFRVLRPEPRGIGDSAGPMQGITLHDLADDVAAVIEHEDNGPAVVVGHAYGHFVARTLAADHPQLVRGVVIAAAGARNYPPHLSDLVTKSADPALPEQERLGYLQTLFFAPGGDASTGSTAGIRRSRGANAQPPPPRTKNDWWPVAKQPILDLQSGQDPFRPRETVNDLRDAFGDLVTVAVIPDARHAQIPEAPDAVVEAIAQWLKTLSA